MRRTALLALGALALVFGAAVACGGASDGNSGQSASNAKIAPQYELEGITPVGDDDFEVATFSTASREGYVTVLYFSFVG